MFKVDRVLRLNRRSFSFIGTASHCPVMSVTYHAGWLSSCSRNCIPEYDEITTAVILAIWDFGNGGEGRFTPAVYIPLLLAG